MCGRMKASDNRVYSLHGMVEVVDTGGQQLQFPWEGFVRADVGSRLGEIKAYWKRLNPEPVDVPITAFAERWAPDTWFQLPKGCVVYGLVVDEPIPLRQRSGQSRRVLKICTREATLAERPRIQHHRIPVFGPRRFGKGGSRAHP